jgi:hypothetical protein
MVLSRVPRLGLDFTKTLGPTTMDQGLKTSD